MSFKSIRRKIKSFYTRLTIKLKSKKYQGLPYLYQKNGSDSLLIVFSAFTGENRRYNYVSSFKSLNADKLFILDPWGYLGSYYLYENGEDYPKRITQSLINHVINGGGTNMFTQQVRQKEGVARFIMGYKLALMKFFLGHANII